ncbi:hypothetical protein H0H92_012369 [Tricholoma furcatifolium]|nr:hypothetical protein H0H92_012369 [Tricholoma furcatifolium]
MFEEPKKALLFGDATQERFETLAKAQENEEGFVNGLWFSILSKCFGEKIRSLEYCVNPEVAHEGIGPRGGDGHSDLLVTKNDFKKGKITWQVIVEGKAGDSEDTFQDALTQLQNYAGTIDPGHFCYLIVAKGRTCMFWKYLLGDHPAPISKLKPMSVDAYGKVGWGHFEAPLSEMYSIVDNQEEIAVLLDHILQNPGGRDGTDGHF